MPMTPTAQTKATRPKHKPSPFPMKRYAAIEANEAATVKMMGRSSQINLASRRFPLEPEAVRRRPIKVLHKHMTRIKMTKESATTDAEVAHDRPQQQHKDSTGWLASSAAFLALLDNITPAPTAMPMMTKELTIAPEMSPPSLAP